MGEDDDGEKIRCVKWIKWKGANPQTGEMEERETCQDSFEIKLLMEISQMVRQNTASTDKVATEVRHHHETFFNALDESRRTKVKQLEEAERIKLENKGGDQ